MKRLFITLLGLNLMWTAVASADEIKVEGGGTSIATIFRPIKNRFEKYHGHTLTIVQSTAVKGLIALNDGKVDIATGAHPLEDLIAGAAKSGVTIDPSNLVATPVEENRLMVIANKEISVRQLSKEQLKGIFTGTITNWKELGGGDVPVEVVWGKETQGQNMQFTRTALDNQAVTAKARQVATYRDITDAVSQLRGGIGVVPLQLATGAIRSIDTMSMPTQMYIITKGKPSEKVQQVIDFYKQEFTFN